MGPTMIKVVGKKGFARGEAQNRDCESPVCWCSQPQSCAAQCLHKRSPSRSTNVPLTPALASTGYENLEKSHQIKLNQGEFGIRFPNIVILKGELLLLLIMHKMLGSVLFPLKPS